MIVKISSRGTSFSGLATYLTHDSNKARTDERVGWTHTLNCAHDHVLSAVDEMYWTAQNAELLKQEAGIRAGGRATENTVLHASLNWAPDERPTREHMIETTEGFLRHMGWEERQAVLVAHTDKEYAHVHVMVNAIHPETGLCLNDSFEQRRAQAWALEYERENNRIYCEQRLLNTDEREDGPTRPAWMAFKNQEKEFENSEKMLRENTPDLSENQNNPVNANDIEWKRLKEIQRQERVDFFVDGKSEFSELRKSIYREVREEFREGWANYYELQKSGFHAEKLAEIKAGLIADQKETLEQRRDEACKELRESRDGIYRELLDTQREDRESLRWRQELGLENDLFLQRTEDRYAEKDIAERFNAAADQFGERRDAGEAAERDAFNGWSRDDREGMRSGTAAMDKVGEGLGFAAISFMESLCDGFVGSKPDPKPRAPERDPPASDLFQAAANAARDARQQREQQENADEEWRKKQRSYGE